MKYLPSEIIIDVLSRLPVRSVACCKCVCKSWLRLLETNEFIKTHLSKSLPGWLVRDYNNPPYPYLLFDLEVGPNLVNEPVAKFNNLPICGWIYGSSDGMLFYPENIIESPKLYVWNPFTGDFYLQNIVEAPKLYVCNPITRDYIELHYYCEFAVCSPSWVAYGFGKSKVTGQYKVVRISQGYLESTESLAKTVCQVYTLGTGLWRTVAPGFASWYNSRPVFLNGNLHWLVYDSSHIPHISCFDLETEVFTTFSTPNLGGYYFDVYTYDGNSLCLYAIKDYYEWGNESFIWVMKDYGVENSWTKEFIDTSRQPPLVNTLITLLHTSSFLSLKSFAREKVWSF